MSHTLSLVFVLLNLHSNFMRYCHGLGNKGTERLSNVPKVPQHQGWGSDPGSQVPETRLSNTMSCCSSLVISTSLMSHMRGTGPRQSERFRKKELWGHKNLPEAGHNGAQTQMWLPDYRNLLSPELFSDERLQARTMSG